MKYLASIFIVLALLLAPIGQVQQQDTAQAYSGIPTFSIVSVKTDTTVTILTNNFPAKVKFSVLMGKIGTRGIGEIKVDTVNSGKGGSFKATFPIPAALKGQYQIAIRLQNTASGYFAYNWFYNDTTAGSGTSGGAPYYGIPTFSITAVKKNTSVTILTSNFPAGDKFVVRMGKIGTRGIGGIKVDKISSGDGGSFKATFNIPDELKGLSQIAIRLESPTSGYYAFNWFWNNSTGGGGSSGSSGGSGTDYSGIPTFSIGSVVKNKTVTIKGSNFPAGDKFDVLMSYMGTRGVGGIKVDNVSTGTGGSFTATFVIPDELNGQFQIAIRLQSPGSGYFAYNWFYNNSTK